MTDKADPIHVLMSRVMDDIGAIGKDSLNQQQGFKFRGIDAVMQSAHRALTKHGVFFLPDVLDRERLDFTTGKGTQMEAVHLHVRFTFYGPAGDSVSCSAWGEASDAGDKATGKAMSMALKSALLQTFCVPTADTEDADATTVDRGDPAAILREQIAAAGEAKGKTRSDLATEFFTATSEDIRTAGVPALTRFLEDLAAPDPSEPDAEREARLDAEAKAIRDLACDPETPVEQLAGLQVRASKSRVQNRLVTGFTGGDFPLREVLDERIKARQRRPDGDES